jgi:membrane-bound inhibitor of C-type lysozyme
VRQRGGNESVTGSFRWVCVGATIAFAATCGASDATEAHYECSGGTGLSARFSPPGVATGQVALTFDGSGRKIALPQVPSADGGRYAGGKVEFWIKGRGATLVRAGKSETCRTP